MTCVFISPSDHACTRPWLKFGGKRPLRRPRGLRDVSAVKLRPRDL